MRAFLNNKITHACHWKTVEWSPTQNSLTINKDESQVRNLSSSNPLEVLRTITVEASSPNTTFISPVNYEGYWYLTFYSPTDDIAQESTLNVKGSVEILSDGEVFIQGTANSGENIELRELSSRPTEKIPYI